MRFLRSLYFKFFVVILAVLCLSSAALLWAFKTYGKEHFNKIVNSESELINGRIREWGRKVNEAFYSSITLSKARSDKFTDEHMKLLSDNVKVMRHERGVDAVNIFSPESLNDPKMTHTGDTMEGDAVTRPINCLSCHSKELTPYRLQALKTDESAFVYGEFAKNMRNEDNYQITTHLYNQQTCQQCHNTNNKMAGIVQLNLNLLDSRTAIKELKEATIKEIDKTNKIITVMLVVNFITAILATFSISFVIKKVIKLKEVFESICYGNTDVDVDAITKSRDEMGDIGDALSRMVTAIKIYLK